MVYEAYTNAFSISAPGDFFMESSQLYADMQNGEVTVTVFRHNGSDGDAEVQYVTT